MVAIHQMYIGNYVYMSSYTRWKQNSNGYTHVSVIKQHEETIGNIVLRLGVLEIEDDSH